LSAVSDVSKTSIRRVEETPDVSQMSDKKSSTDVPGEKVVLDEATFQQKRPPVPLPRTRTPQKSKPPAPVDKVQAPSTASSFGTHPALKKRYFPTPEFLKTPTYLMRKAEREALQTPTHLKPCPIPKKKYFPTPEPLRSPSYLKQKMAASQRASPKVADAW
jgi:hypothetical protein